MPDGAPADGAPADGAPANGSPPAGGGVDDRADQGSVDQGMREPSGKGEMDAPPTKESTDASADGVDGGSATGREYGLRAGETGTAGDRAGFRLAAFGALLVVVLFAGYGLGRLNSETTSASAPTAAAANGGNENGGAANGSNGNGGAANGGNGNGGNESGGTGNDGMANGGAMAGMVMDENQPHSHNNDGTVAQEGTTPVGSTVGGLSLSSAGLTLAPAQTSFVAGKRQRLSFRITGAGGAPITTYAVVHDKLLHLVVIRRDLSDFQHLHPSMAADGTWGIDLMLARPGIYRMIADFTALVGGKPVATTLGSDLTVAGNYAPTPLPAPVRAVATDGFAVGYEGAPSVTSTQPILVSVAGPDRRPAMLEPYLGAYGHLVVLRDGDLAYVHVHPEAALVDGKVKFWLSVPSSGVYRMFFDFQVAGRVHTAAWTVRVS